jgi:acyl-CoA synthetase
MLADHVASHAAAHGDEPAFITPGGRLSWQRYDACSNRLAAALLGAGVEVGDRVAIQLPDSASVHVAYLGCEKAGAVAVGIGARAGERELRHLLGRTRAMALISHDLHRGRDMAALFSTLGRGLHRHVVVPRFESEPDGQIEVNGAPAVERALSGERRLGPEDLWMVNSTSGTTGLPKCVMHSQNRWWYFHLMATEVAELTPDDVLMSVVPSPFGFGQWSSHFTPCYLGVPVVVMERFDAGRTLELIERERVTVLCAVTTQFRMLLAEPAIEERDLTSLRVMFTGGEAIPYEPARRFEQLTGARILNFYGSNESGFATATRLSDPPERRLRTSGRTLPGTELRLFDDERRDVTATRRGQPGTRGPAVCLGYLDDPAANQQLFTADGFVLHADIVELDEEGYLTVVGRKSDIIIRGGKNISAAEVEQEVARHPRVALAAAVPVPDELFGERVCVYVELRDSDGMELGELVDFLAQSGTSKELLPEHLVVLDELPRSSGDKVAKAELREDASKRLLGSLNGQGAPR